MSWWQERHWQVIKQGVLDWDRGRVPGALRSWFRGDRESLFWEDMYLSLSYGQNNLNLGGMRKMLSGEEAQRIFKASYVWTEGQSVTAGWGMTATYNWRWSPLGTWRQAWKSTLPLSSSMVLGVLVHHWRFSGTSVSLVKCSRWSPCLLGYFEDMELSTWELSTSRKYSPRHLTTTCVSPFYLWLTFPKTLTFIRGDILRALDFRRRHSFRVKEQNEKKNQPIIQIWSWISFVCLPQRS